MASFAPIRMIHNMTFKTEGRICLSRTGRSHSVLYPPNPRLITSTRRRYVCCNAGPNEGVSELKQFCIKLSIRPRHVRDYLSPNNII